jgi:ribosomal protein S1
MNIPGCHISEPYPFADDLFSPESTDRWEQLKQRLATGTVLTGSVCIQAPFGVFYDAGLGFPVLLNVTEFGREENTLFPDNYPALNSTISGAVWGLDDSKRQIRVLKHPLATSYWL